jgi:hypothetical protein
LRTCRRRGPALPLVGDQGTVSDATAHSRQSKRTPAFMSQRASGRCLSARSPWTTRGRPRWRRTRACFPRGSKRARAPRMCANFRARRPSRRSRGRRAGGGPSSVSRRRRRPRSRVPRGGLRARAGPPRRLTRRGCCRWSDREVVVAAHRIAGAGECVREGWPVGFESDRGTAAVAVGDDSRGAQLLAQLVSAVRAGKHELEQLVLMWRERARLSELDHLRRRRICVGRVRVRPGHGERR